MSTTLNNFLQARQARADEQGFVNALAYAGESPALVHAAFQARAEAQVAAYPQYAGHFEGYTLVHFTRRVRTKAGVAFEKGDVALLAPRSKQWTAGYRAVWSLRNAVDTSVPLGSYVEGVR